MMLLLREETDRKPHRQNECRLCKTLTKSHTKTKVYEDYHHAGQCNRCVISSCSREKQQLAQGTCTKKTARMIN